MKDPSKQTLSIMNDYVKFTSGARFISSWERNKYLKEKVGATEERFDDLQFTLTGKEIIENNCAPVIGSETVLIKAFLYKAKMKGIDAIGILANSVSDYVNSFQNEKSTDWHYVSKKLSLIGVRASAQEPYCILESTNGFLGITAESINPGDVIWYPAKDDDGRGGDNYRGYKTKVITYAKFDFEELNSCYEVIKAFFGKPTHSLPIEPMIGKTIEICEAPDELAGILYRALNNDEALLNKYPEWIDKIPLWAEGGLRELQMKGIADLKKRVKQ